MIANLNGMRLDGSQAPLEVRLSVGCVLGQSTPFRSMAGYAHGTRFVFSLYYPFTFVVGYAISRGLFLLQVNFYICLMKWISLHLLTLAWWIRWSEERRTRPDTQTSYTIFSTVGEILRCSILSEANSPKNAIRFQAY